MARSADQEMIAIEKVVCSSQFPRGGCMGHPAGPHGEAQCQLGGRRGEARARARDFFVVLRE